MINEFNVEKFCYEDISLIENYEEAVADEQIWDCHHKLGIELNKSKEELKEMGLYFNRPACELIFLKHAEHTSLHHNGKIAWNKGKKATAETLAKMSKAMKGKKHSVEAKTKISTTLKGIKRSQETREKLSSLKKGVKPKKYQWLTPDGKIRIMDKTSAKHHHPDWKCLGIIENKN